MGFGLLQLSTREVEAVKCYQYKGTDLSYLYRFVLTPMNNRLIEYFPLWLAPNLITMLGLLFIISGNVLTWYFNDSFHGTMPSWVYLWCGICLFMYQTLDNLDGKQARRTGSSSPLGLLFDHGVDAVNSTVANLMFMSVLQLPLDMRVFLCWCIAIVPFAFATWEEFFTGELVLPIINGPSDGVFLCIVGCIAQALQPGFWGQSLAYNFPAVFAGTSVAHYETHWLYLMLGLVGIIITGLYNTYVVLSSSWGTGHGIIKPLACLLPFVTIVGCGFVWMWLCPHIVQDHPRVFISTLGFLFSNVVCKLMLAHLTHSNFDTFRWTLVPLLAATANLYLRHVHNPWSIDTLHEYHVLFALLVWSFVTWYLFVVKVVEILCEVLDINCFTIPAVTKKAS